MYVEERMNKNALGSSHLFFFLIVRESKTLHFSQLFSKFSLIILSSHSVIAIAFLNFS